MAETILVKRIQTENGTGQVDYESLANLPVIDNMLKTDSANAVQNKVIATAFNNINTKVDTVKNELVSGDITVNNSTNFNGQPASYYAALNTQGISTYTHSKSGTVHNFTGSGNNGKAKMTANVSAGDTFTVNGQSVSAYCGPESAASAMAGEAYSGKWVTFVFDGAQLNFKGGGGLSNSKLALATATESDVLSGKTFYGNSKSVKTGNIASKGSDSVTLNASTTSYTFGTSGKYCTGNMTVSTSTRGAESVTLNASTTGYTFDTSGKLCTGNMTVNTSTMAGTSVTLNPGGSYTFATSGKLCTGNMTVNVNTVNTWPVRTYCPYNSRNGSNVSNQTVYLPLPDGDGNYYIALYSADIQSTGDAYHYLTFQGEVWVNNTNNGGNYGVHPDFSYWMLTRTITNSNRTITYSWRHYGTILFVYCRYS